MEGLVNYSSEDEQDDYSYKKVAVRERSGDPGGSGRNTNEVSATIKRNYEQSKLDSFNSESSRKRGESGNELFKVGNNYNEDKYKFDRRADNARDHKEKRDVRETRYTRDTRDDYREHDYKKLDDQKRYREQKRDYKRDVNDYYREDKRYNRHEERKSSYAANNKDRLSTSRTRHDERKQYDDRFSDERRGNGGGGSHNDDRKKEYHERRNYNNDDDRRTDRRVQRSYNDDRSNACRPRRSTSPLPSLHNKPNSKYSERKEEGTIRRERKRHSRSRSRSHSPEKSIDSTKISNQRIAPAERSGEFKRTEAEAQSSEKKTLPNARNFEALLTLPLTENAPKHPNVVTVPATNAVAPSNSATTTVQLPSYYNPNVINPNKYVEQMQKRKLIWGAKKSEDSASKWGHAQFSQDQDGKVASKFMRLMGIKNTTTGTGGESSTSPNKNEMKSPSSTSPPNNIDVKSREAMFSTMEQQYEVARQVTHTMRGVGLGFSSQSRPY